MPNAPGNVEETRIRRKLLEDLALKTLYVLGELTLRELAEHMCLGMRIVEELFQRLRKDQLCQVTGMTGGVHRIVPTSEGKVRALELLALNQYAGKSIEDSTTSKALIVRVQALALEKRRRGIELSTARLEAGALTEKKEFDRAVAAWTRILADWPDIGANHVGLAAALAGQGQLDAAAAQYERALALDAGTSVYRQLAALYDRMGRPDAAAATRAKLAQTEQHTFGVDAQR